MNLVVIVDRGFRGEVENRLARVGRYHPSRLVIVAVEEGRTQLDAWATVAAEDAVHKPGHIAVGRERVEVDIGPQLLELARHDRRPAARLRPHHDGLGAARPRRRASTRCAGWPTSSSSTRRTSPSRGWPSSAPPTSTRSAYVVDLAWLRSTPWRERVAATFDPPAMRRALRRDRARSSCATARTRPRPACCSAAGSHRGWAGGRRRSRATRRRAHRPRPRAPRRGGARAAAGGDGLARAWAA